MVGAVRNEKLTRRSRIALKLVQNAVYPALGIRIQFLLDSLGYHIVFEGQLVCVVQQFGQLITHGNVTQLYFST